MSHFLVLVVGQNPEQQLAKYDERLQVEFCDITDKRLQEYKTGTVEIVVFENGQRYSKYDKAIEPFWQRKYAPAICSEDKLVLPKDAKLQTVPFTEFYPTFEIFMCEWCGETKQIDGRYGYMYNPNAKWDWYELGGRWAGALPLKNGREVDKAIFGDVDMRSFRSPFAVLKNGVWHERGQLRCFGMAENEKRQGLWDKEVKQLLADVAPDTPVAMYDCHI